MKPTKFTSEISYPTDSCSAQLVEHIFYQSLSLCSSSLSSWPFIGFYDRDDNDVFVWLNGNPLPDDDENWLGGKTATSLDMGIKLAELKLSITNIST